MFAKSMNNKGASLVEYGTIVGLIATLSIGTVLSLGTEIEGAFEGTTTELAGAVEVAVGGGASPSPPPTVVVPATTHNQDVSITGNSNFPTSPLPSSSFAGPLTATSDPATVCTMIGYPSATNPQIISGRNLTAATHALTTVYSLQLGFNFVGEGTLTNNASTIANDPTFIANAIIIESIDCS